MRLKGVSLWFCLVHLGFLLVNIFPNFINCDEIVINLHASPPSISSKTKMQLSSKEQHSISSLKSPQHRPQQFQRQRQPPTRPSPTLGASPAFNHDYIETAESQPVGDSTISRGDFFPEESPLEQEYHYYGDDKESQPFIGQPQQHQQLAQSAPERYSFGKPSNYRQNAEVEHQESHYGEEEPQEDGQGPVYLEDEGPYNSHQAVEHEEVYSPSLYSPPPGFGGFKGNGHSRPIPVPVSVGPYPIQQHPGAYHTHQPPASANWFKEIELGEFALLFIPAALLTLVYIFYVAANSPNNAHTKYFIDGKNHVGYPGGQYSPGSTMSMSQMMNMAMTRPSQQMNSRPQMMNDQYQMPSPQMNYQQQMPSGQMNYNMMASPSQNQMNYQMPQQRQHMSQNQQQMQSPPKMMDPPSGLMEVMQNMSPSMLRHISPELRTLLATAAAKANDNDDEDDDNSSASEEQSVKKSKSKLAKIENKAVKAKEVKSAKSAKKTVVDKHLLFPSAEVEPIKIEEAPAER